MTRISELTFEADKGQSIHNFSQEICRLYDRIGKDLVGIYNDIRLNVNQYENPMSLYWQYQYKKEV